MPPKKSSVAAWFQSSFPCISLVWSAVTTQNELNEPEPTFQEFLELQRATAARMMCLYVLVVVATSCLGRVLHAILEVDALPTISPCVDIFHVDPSHSRESVERRVRKHCLVNRVDLVQLGGHLTKPEVPYSVARGRGGTARHVRQDRLAAVPRANKVTNKVGRILENHHFGVGHAE